MKENFTTEEKGTLKKKESNLYKLAFGLLAVAGFVFVPMFEIAKAFDVCALEIISALATTAFTAGGMGSAYAADKEGKKEETEEEKEI